jgi:hypothetical protein
VYPRNSPTLASDINERHAKCTSRYGAGRGNRTPTGLSALRILSPLRLPISPSRQIMSALVWKAIYCTASPMLGCHVNHSATSGASWLFCCGSPDSPSELVSHSRLTVGNLGITANRKTGILQALKKLLFPGIFNSARARAAYLSVLRIGGLAPPFHNTKNGGCPTLPALFEGGWASSRIFCGTARL